MARISYEPEELINAMKKIFVFPDLESEQDKLLAQFDKAFWESLTIGFDASKGVPLSAMRVYMLLQDALDERKKKSVRFIDIADEHIPIILQYFKMFTDWNIHTAPIVLLVEKKLEAALAAIPTPAQEGPVHVEAIRH